MTKKMLHMNPLEEFDDVIVNRSLIFIAGIVWIGAGLLLLSYALSWLSHARGIHVFYFAGAGVALALLIHHFGFLKIVNINTRRIMGMTRKKSLFSFISVKSYILIAVMVALGITLRHSAIPKPYLSVIYIGIGLALILSSVRYLRFFFREVRKPRS